MKRQSKYIIGLSILLFTLMIGFFSPFHAINASAKGDLDEILEYRIKVEPQPDATLNIEYNIRWKVLDSDSYGPLDEVKVGIPNKHCYSATANSSTIKNLETIYSGEYLVKMDLDRKYYKNEVVDLSFSITTDYMYQLNDDQSQAVYSFTPGWFDDIKVDLLEISWKIDQIESWTPDAIIDNGYVTWTTSLNKGDKFNVKVTYPASALGFNLNYQTDSDKSNDTEEDLNFFEGLLVFIIACVMLCVVFAVPVGIIIIPIILAVKAYRENRGFGNSTQKKITRTKIEYYPSCPNCGGTKAEDSDVCAFCGTNMIKSQETIEEADVARKAPEIEKYKSEGLFHYGSSPNTYVRVHVVNVPRPRPVRTTSTHSSSSTRSHSSCAHSSCACACACACAGGGRAGCTTKDFYNTNLKLENLKPKKK